MEEPSHVMPTHTLLTVESVRQRALEDFARFEEVPSLFNQTPFAMQQQCALGRALLEKGLTLADGEELDLEDALRSCGVEDREQALRSALGVLPYLCGGLRLLDMEFWHAEAGVVSASAVRRLLEGEAVELEGVTLSRDNVLIRYRRLPLNRA